MVPSCVPQIGVRECFEGLLRRHLRLYTVVLCMTEESALWVDGLLEITATDYRRGWVFNNGHLTVTIQQQSNCIIPAIKTGVVKTGGERPAFEAHNFLLFFFSTTLVRS